jgi:phosphoglycerol transferase MdoB-like AlkP superfamily enzyme
MRTYLIQLKDLGIRLVILLALYQLCRISFLIFNNSFFSNFSFAEIAKVFFYGFRFDFSAIVITNFLFIFLHLVPWKIYFTKTYQVILTILFLLVNIPALLLNCIDLEYFKYQGKRTTADLFSLFGMGEDMKNTIPQMLRDFWYVLLVLLVIVLIGIFLYNRTKTTKPVKLDYGIMPWMVIFPLLSLFALLWRGGIQYKPIGIMTAAQHTSAQLVPLVLNTPFTVIRTLGKVILEDPEYFSEAESKKYFNKEHHYRKNEPFKPLNIVFIILESFSSEYIGGFNNGKGYTPVLDSLMQHSLVYTNTYANAKKSIDGIPAIIAAMPTLMPGSYITSPYNGNKLNSIGGILKNKAYSSGFFHGGNNGTMGFDNFALITGFDKYYGRNEYGNGDYDGNWGVFDEPFYYFFADNLNKMKEPFVCSFFSLSSHHPYSLPSHLHNKFHTGTLPIHESIRYADYAMGKFFEKVKNERWYNNTLFIITSDHTGPSEKPYYQTKAGIFKIPLLYYYPGGELKGTRSEVTQQTDIVPSVLDFINYDLPFVAFGNSVFNSDEPRFAMNYTGEVYQIFDNNNLLQFDGQFVTGLYQYKNDSLLQSRVPGNQTNTNLEFLAKSVIQQYNRAMIYNKLTPDVLNSNARK